MSAAGTAGDAKAADPVDAPHAGSAPLHAEIRGPESGLPIVLVHGFAADGESWMNVQTALAPHHRTIAFDLPGHGGSRAHAVGNARVLGDAVAASLAAMGHSRVHLVGHSLGGAVSAVYAMRRPDEVASLTLLAPGGFGPEINHRLLRRMAEATEEHELQLIVEEFFGWEAKVPRMLAAHIAAQRRDPAALAPLRALLDSILDGDVQKTLDPTRLAALGCPVKVLWGTQDRVLPTRQAHRLPGVIATHIFGWEAKVPRMLAAHIAAQRRDPAALAPLGELLGLILDGDVQKTFDPARLAGLGCPVKVLWGTQDRVLPTRQAHRLPGVIATHIFERVGHMVHLEVPHESVRLIRENVAAGEALSRPAQP